MFELIAALYKKLNFYKTLADGRLAVVVKRNNQIKDMTAELAERDERVQELERALDEVNDLNRYNVNRAIGEFHKRQDLESTVQDQSVKIDDALTDKAVAELQADRFERMVGRMNETLHELANGYEIQKTELLDELRENTVHGLPKQ